MSGRLTRIAIRTLDAVSRVVLRPAPAVRHLETGRRGEEEAYFYLRKLGYIMVARNFRSPRFRGEIDLIGWDGDTLCFIEVKTRTTLDVKPAEAAVDHHKQHDLRLVARDYLRRVAGTPLARFDVLSVYFYPGSKSADFTLFKNAFPAS